MATLAQPSKAAGFTLLPDPAAETLEAPMSSSFAEVIEVQGIPNIDRALEMMEKFGSQIDFANSKAINLLAEDVRDFTVNTLLPGKLTLRKPWWKPRTRFGVNVQYSNKKNLQGKVFSRAPWLDLQEEGGRKTYAKVQKGKSTPLVLIPRKDLRQKESRLIPSKLSPKKLLGKMKKKRVFWIGDNLWMRTGKEDRAIEPLFFGKTETQVKATLGFVSSAKGIVAKNYDKRWGQALAFAMATAKGSIKTGGL